MPSAPPPDAQRRLRRGQRAAPASRVAAPRPWEADDDAAIPLSAVVGPWSHDEDDDEDEDE